MTNTTYYSHRLIGFEPTARMFLYETIYPEADIIDAASFLVAVDGKLKRNHAGEFVITYYDDKLLDGAY